MSHVSDMVPQISHIMPVSYYNGLVKISNPAKIRQLMQLALEPGGKKETLCAKLLHDWLPHDGFHHESCLVKPSFPTQISASMCTPLCHVHIYVL